LTKLGFIRKLRPKRFRQIGSRFTWQNVELPQLQLLQRSIIIHCQPVRALRYHSSLFIYR
jgi:hypothetical protein